MEYIIIVQNAHHPHVLDSVQYPYAEGFINRNMHDHRLSMIP